MIKNWQHLNKIENDFSSYTNSNRHPSDIDMSYIANGDTWIIGEIKNELGELKEGQRHILEKYVNNWKKYSLCLFITHDKYVEHGDTRVDIMNCKVKEMYTQDEKQWRKPKKETKVIDVIEFFDGKRV